MRLTLAAWQARHNESAHEHKTGSTFVYDFLLEASARVALFRLSDFAVSTVSGVVIWLVPVNPSHWANIDANR